MPSLNEIKVVQFVDTPELEIGFFWLYDYASWVMPDDSQLEPEKMIIFWRQGRRKMGYASLKPEGIYQFFYEDIYINCSAPFASEHMLEEILGRPVNEAVSLTRSDHKLRQKQLWRMKVLWRVTDEGRLWVKIENLDGSEFATGIIPQLPKLEG